MKWTPQCLGHLTVGTPILCQKYQTAAVNYFYRHYFTLIKIPFTVFKPIKDVRIFWQNYIYLKQNSFICKIVDKSIHKGAATIYRNHNKKITVSLEDCYCWIKHLRDETEISNRIEVSREGAQECLNTRKA